jgi:hypothetical protein
MECVLQGSGTCFPPPPAPAGAVTTPKVPRVEAPEIRGTIRNQTLTRGENRKHVLVSDHVLLNGIGQARPPRCGRVR